MKFAFLYKLIALITRKIFPGIRYCLRCGYSFGFVNAKAVITKTGYGGAPLCKKCFNSISNNERIYYYHKLFEFYNKNNMNPNFTIDGTIKALKLYYPNALFTRGG